MTDPNTTHFGYKQVDSQEKAGLVRNVFDSVANRYDIMNDLMSFGIHRLWKRLAIDLAGVRAGQRVSMSDINAAMLERGRDRLIDLGITANIDYVQLNAEQIPFPDNHFDLVSIAFGLRNVTHKEQALAEMLRVIKPGGRALVLEFSQPREPLLQKAYDAYSFGLLPLMGRLVAQDAESYRYLAESIRMHPNQESLQQMMEGVGFERVDFHNMTGGIVAVHRGFKA